jgi:hypothetical protein
MKTCHRCKENKPESEYQRNPGTKDGLQSSCRACVSIMNKAWVAANKERNAATDKAYRETHRDQRNAKRQEWRAGCRAEQAEVNNSWREINRESINARRQEIRNADPERTRALRRAEYLRFREQRKAHNAVNHAVRDGRLEPVMSFCCVLCGLPAEQYHHHNGYDDDHLLDVIPVCKRCHGRQHRKY